jgi:hypothetical protein
MKPNLDIDLFKTDWIVSKCVNSDVYSQNLYAAICNNLFYKEDEEWSASWRTAGGIVADLRNKGESYIDHYCSGMIDKEGYAPEGFVTDEIRKDLLKIGWTIKSYEPKVYPTDG